MENHWQFSFKCQRAVSHTRWTISATRAFSTPWCSVWRIQCLSTPSAYPKITSWLETSKIRIATIHDTLHSFKSWRKIRGRTRLQLFGPSLQFGVATGSASRGTLTSFSRFTLNRFWIRASMRNQVEFMWSKTKLKHLYSKYSAGSCALRLDVKSVTTAVTPLMRRSL